MITKDYVDSYVYDSQGHTGNTYYFRLIEQRGGGIWDTVAKALATSPTWINSAISMTEVGTNGAFPITIPADLPAGIYDAVVYKQDGSNPQNTDDVQKQVTVRKGDVFGF